MRSPRGDAFGAHTEHVKLLAKGRKMISFRTLAALALVVGVVGLVAVANAAQRSTTDPGPVPYDYDAAPIAQASGGDAGPPLYPSIVNVRLVRAEAALARATTWVDQGIPANAVVELYAARSNMRAAWTAATYVIENAPPPVAGDGAFAHTSGGAVAGAFASPEETGFAVLSLQHDVVTTAIGLIDTVDATLLPNLRPTIRGAINARDAAIAYIHSIAPPPVAGDGSVHADASGTPVASGWDTLMPTALPILDDEIQEIKGTVATNTALATGVPGFLRNMRLRDLETQNTINQYWPPLPGDG
jgi:hypothetical protein